MSLMEAIKFIEKMVTKRCMNRLRHDAISLAKFRYCQVLATGTIIENPVGLLTRITIRAVVDVCRSGNKHRSATDQELFELVDTHDDLGEIDVSDMLAHLAHDEIDHKILTMRAAGFSFREIEQELTMSKSGIDRRVQTLMEKASADVSAVRRLPGVRRRIGRSA